MNTVLIQEINRYDKLLGVIHKSLKELIKALKGEIMISKDSENIYISFLNQKIPESWEVLIIFHQIFYKNKS
jgi:dynein heavy chain